MNSHAPDTFPRRVLRPFLLGMVLLALGAGRAGADSYLWTDNTGGDWNKAVSGSDPRSPAWQDQTPFGSNTPPPRGGDTAIFGDYDDPLSPGGPQGITITGSASIATLEAGHVTFNAGITASKAMDFGGFGSGNVTLAGGTYHTVALNGSVDMNGASLSASGDTNLYAHLTGGASLTGTTASLFGGTMAGATATFSGATLLSGLTVGSGGKLQTGDATAEGVFITGGTWTATGEIIATASSPNVTAGGSVISDGAELNDNGFYGNGGGQGFAVSGAGSQWHDLGDLDMGTITNDTGALSVLNGGTVAVDGDVTMGADGGEFFVKGADSDLETGAITAENGAVKVTNGGGLLTNGGASFDEGDAVGGSLVDGADSIWKVTGTLTLGNMADGVAACSVSNTARLQIGGELVLGDKEDSDGTLTINNDVNGLTVAKDAIIGKGGTGELDITGNGGVTGGAPAGNDATLGGNFVVGGGGDGTSAANGTVYVSQQGVLAASDAADFTELAVNAADTGELLVTDAGSVLTLAGDAVIGFGGNVLVGAVRGAVVTSGDTSLAIDKTATGEMDVFDPGTIWTCSALGTEDADGETTTGNAVIAANNYGIIHVQSDFFVGTTTSVYVSAAVPANANAAFRYKVAPSDKTHAGGQIFVGTDNYGPDGTIRVGHGGTLHGQAKTLMANVAVGAEGTFAPGDGKGTFTVTGNCDLSDGGAGAGGGETDLQLGGTPGEDKTPGTDYDQLVVTGTATLGGTLKATLKEGYVPVNGDVFKVIHAGTVSGAFAGIAAPTGVVLVPSIDEDGDFVLTVTEVAIGSPPDITSPSTATATVGQPFTYQIVATNGPISYGATGLPVGLSVNTATGLISGTPMLAGTYQVGLAATSADHEGDGALTLTVLPAPPPGSPVIGSVLAASAQIGAVFTYQIAASNTPTSYDATGLPAGLSVSTTTGLVSGTPTVSGVFAVMLTATNAIGTGTATLTLTVSGPTVPTVTATATVKVAHAEAGTPGVFTISLSPPPSVKTVIRYTLKGSAVNGQDYVLLTGKAKIKPGKPGTTVQIVPRVNAAAGKSVKLVITPSSAFTVGNAAPPKVKIKP